MKYIVKSTIISFILTIMAFATTINVPADKSTIQAGLNATNEGDTVLVAVGTYTENIIWPETNGIKLISAGDSSNTIINGGGTSSVIYMNPSSATIDTTTLIQGFKITNGGGVSNGGGIFINNCSPSLSFLNIQSNTSLTNGGGIFFENTSSNPKLFNSSILNNESKNGGGFWVKKYRPVLYIPL